MTSGRCPSSAADRVLVGAVLACTSLFWARPINAAPDPETPPAESYRFSIDSKINDEVVGKVQITETGPEDALADIARRFSVGYNEIHRANPGVDMWVPGAGNRIVVPTQYVLPNAPQVGIVVTSRNDSGSQSATRELLEQAMRTDIQKELQARNEEVRWDLVLQLAQDPQGIPVAITDPNSSLAQVLAAAPDVQNRAPDGALGHVNADRPIGESERPTAHLQN